MDSYRNFISRENLIILIIAGAILVFNFIVSIAYIVLRILGIIKYGQYKDYDYAFAINFIKWLIRYEDKIFIYFYG